MDLAGLDQRLSEIHRGRRWIVAVEVAAAALETVEQLRAWGTGGVIVVAGARGVGEQPDAEIVFTGDGTADTMMGAMRAFYGSLSAPAPEVTAAVDAFDPFGEAGVLIPDVHSAQSVFGRRVYGDRGPEALALEDKMLADEVWDAAGVTRAPAEIVPVPRASEAARRLANEHGTVWVADNRLGWHGGASYVRWVGPHDDPDAIAAWFAESAGRVRVMPFLEGIPCSIHGFVTRDGVAAFRPVEIITLRRTDRREFLYAGVATFWDPSDSDRKAMRDVARSVAAVIAARVPYLGPFSVDGVMTAGGFRPTELNPRMSAGIGRMASTVEGLPLAAVVRALREGDLEVEAEEVEQLIVAAADARRTGGVHAVVPGAAFPASADEAEIPVVVRDGRLRRTIDDEQADGVVTGGDNPAGSLVRLTPDPERTPTGPSIGPLATALMQFVQQEWGLPVGSVAAAPDVRSATQR